MFYRKLFKRLALTTALFGLASSVALAHPGHPGADSPFHALLHPEHLLVLLAVGVLVVIDAVSRRH